MVANYGQLNDRRYEDAIVGFLSTHFELDETKTRFVLRDLEREQANAGDTPSLTFRAWQLLFPDFPVAFDCYSVSATQAKGKPFSLPMLIEEPENSLFGRHFQERCEAAGEGKCIATVYQWPNIRPSRSLVVHDLPEVPIAQGDGGKFRFLTRDDKLVCIKTLWNFFQTMNHCFPPSTWMESAIRSDFKEPLSR